MSVSLEWQKALTVVARAESVLSFLGSAWICQHVLLSPKKRGRVYHRMLLGMSLGDLIKSIVRFCLQWCVPAEEYGWWGARGTRFTCIMQGFLLQLSLVSSLYNAGLSLYCLFTVRYAWSEKKTARLLEPWVHGLCWAISLGQAIAGIPLKLYNSRGFVCYIGPWPPNCTQSWKSPDGKGTCERGDNATLYTVFFFEVWHWLAVLCTAVSMFMVYWRLRHQENRNQRYNFAQQVMMQQQQQQQEGSRMSIFSRQQYATRPAFDRKASGKFAMQALLYVLVFYICHIFSSIWTLHNLITGGSIFGILVVAAFFAGLEGFFNFLVYIRPRYIRLQKERKEMQAWRLINEVVSGNSTTACRPGPSQQTHKSTVSRNSRQNQDATDLRRDHQKPDTRDDLSPACNHDSLTDQEGNANDPAQEMNGTECISREEGEQLDEY